MREGQSVLDLIRFVKLDANVLLVVFCTQNTALTLLSANKRHRGILLNSHIGADYFIQIQLMLKFTLMS